MSGLVMDDIWEGNVQEYGAINITGLRYNNINNNNVNNNNNNYKKD